MERIRVDSWNALTEELYADSWQEDIGRFRSTYAFRGVPMAQDSLCTSLLRLGCEPREGDLLRAFRKYARRDVSPGASVWDWLALAQHHGLPTRLLDWTYSPFVAMHFATENAAHFDRDGVIWCIDYVQSNQLLPERLRTLLADEGADVFTADMLDLVAESLADFDALAGEEFVVFFEPPSLDQRIVNQFALFSLMSSATARLDRWLAARSHLARQIIIPAELKPEVRDKLDQANITERVLFPGLDGLSRWLKRYYTPRQSARRPKGDPYEILLPGEDAAQRGG